MVINDNTDDDVDDAMGFPVAEEEAIVTAVVAVAGGTGVIAGVAGTAGSSEVPHGEDARLAAGVALRVGPAAGAGRNAEGGATADDEEGEAGDGCTCVAQRPLLA